MSKIGLAELLQQDINELKGILIYDSYGGLTKRQAKIQAKAIIANLEDHLEELIGESIN